MRTKPAKRALAATARVACPLCQDWHEEGKHRYVVWKVAHDGTPIGAGRPFATVGQAKQEAQHAAMASDYDHMVSRGYDALAKGFKLMVRYHARSGVADT